MIEFDLFLKLTILTSILYYSEPTIEDIISTFGLILISVGIKITKLAIAFAFYLLIFTWIKIFFDKIYLNILKIDNIINLQNIMINYVNNTLSEHYTFLKLTNRFNSSYNIE